MKPRTINRSITRHYEPWRTGMKHLVRSWTRPDPKTGKQRRLSVAFEHLREAKAYQVELQTELNRGIHRETSSVTLQQHIEEFTKNRLSLLSYPSQLSLLNTFKQMLEYFGERYLLRDIEQRHAEAFIATRTRCDGKGKLSSWSVARHIINARGLFNAAVRWGFVNSNPFQGIRSNPKSRDWHFLTPMEFQQLLTVVHVPSKRAVYWLLYSGLRPGEVYNLRVGNIDLSARRVHVANRGATEDVPPFTVKAESQSGQSKERWVPIPEAAIPDITEAVKQAFKSGGFIALSPVRFRTVQAHWRLCREGKPWAQHPWRPWLNRDMVNNLLRDTKRYLRQAKVELTAPFQLTSFRKSYAQNLANAGVPPRTLAKLLGHSDTRITMKHYATVTDANERHAAELMNRMFAAEKDVAPKAAQS